jgi:signal transduction histidine kinase
MISPSDTPNEKERIATLKSYNILDTETEKNFDDLTLLASEICGTKISLVSLVDDKRQWFKSKIGMTSSETQKKFSFCGHAIINPEEVFIVPDTRKDERFSNNPLVTGDPNIAFYTGVPLVNNDGIPLGTLCVIDDKPKKLNSNQLKALKTLANQVMNLIELRKKNRELNQLNEKLLRKNEQIEKFAYLAAHDLKSPLANIETYINFLLDDSKVLNTDHKKILTKISNSSNQLRCLVTELLEFSRADSITNLKLENIKVDRLFEEIKSLISNNDNCLISFECELDTINAHKSAITIIFLNLITNSIRYSDKDKQLIKIQITEDNSNYFFEFSDNGPGIDSKKLSAIFDPFVTISNEDRFGNKSTGLGLTQVKKIIQKLGGNIDVKSSLGEGIYFYFNIKKNAFIFDTTQTFDR